jgi:nicotinamidase-related amidase
MDPGFGAQLGIGHQPALLVVDFVDAYLVPDSPLYAGVEDARGQCEILLGAARDAKIPIFHTNVVYKTESDAPVFRRKLPNLKVFESGSPLGKFARGLEPADNETVITKHYASAFFGTALADLLREKHVDSLLIAGVTTSGCIRASAVDAIQHGFAPIVVIEAVGDRSRAAHEANLFDLQAKYADVVSIDSVLDQLRNIAH